MIIKDTFYTLVPINWFLRITALSNIHRKGVEVQTFRSMIKKATYILVLTFVNLLFLYLKLNRKEFKIHDSIFRFTAVIQMTYWLPYFVYIIDLYFVQKYGGDVLIKYIKNFDNIDEALGKSDYDRIRRTIVISMVFSIGVFLFVCLFDYFTWIFIEGWEDPSIYAIDYLYWFLNILTVIDGVSHVIQVEFRLKVIQVLLQKQISVHFIRTNINPDTFHEDTTLQTPLEKLRFTGDLDTTTIIKCYLQLLEQVHFVTTSYGFRVMVHLMNMLFNMINFLNLAIRPVSIVEVLGGMMSTITSTRYISLAIITGILRALNYELMAIMLMYRCEQAYKQSDKILKTIDVLLADARHQSRTKTNLLEFRNLLLTRPIKFHAANFFTLDYRTLVSLNSVVVTYTIIMRQNI